MRKHFVNSAPIRLFMMNSEAKTAAYTIFGTLIVFKLTTALFVFLLAPSIQSAGFLSFTALLWFGLAMLPVLLFGGFWFRRWRVRRKRHLLIAAEWNVAPHGGTSTRVG